MILENQQAANPLVGNDFVSYNWYKHVLPFLLKHTPVEQYGMQTAVFG